MAPAIPRSDFTIVTLKPELARLYNKAKDKDAPEKTEKDFDFINQHDVDNFNEFNKMSAEYHSIGGGERDRFNAYMGDLRFQFSNCVKGKDPQEPAVRVQKDFAKLKLTPAKDWD